MGKQQESGSKMDAAIARAGMNVTRELDSVELPDVNERLDLRVGEHIIARLREIKTVPGKNGGNPFKCYVLEYASGYLYDMLGSSDLDNRRELPSLRGHIVGIERVADEHVSERVSAMKRFRIVDLGADWPAHQAKTAGK